MSAFNDSRERLLALLNSGLELSLVELAEHLGISSERHVRRLIKSLRDEGYRIEDYRVGKNKRFRIPEDKRTVESRPLQLTEAQAFALAVAAEASLAMLEPTPLGGPLREAFGELTSTMSSDVVTFEMSALPQHWHFGIAQTVSLDPVIFQTLSRAIEDCRTVRIDYLTASTGTFTSGRMVDPLVLAVQAGTWLLVAYCHMRQKIIDFALAGISKVESCEDTFFTRPADFDPDLHFRDRFGALSGTEFYTVRLHVEKQKAEYFRRKNYHPTQQIETTNEDGSIVVSYEVAGLDEIRSFIQSWGSGVVVLEPLQLIDRLCEEARRVLEHYAEKTVVAE